MKQFMNNLSGRDYDKFSTSIFATIKEAFSFLTPVFLIGAFALAIRCFPVYSVRTFVETALNGRIYDILGVMYNATYGFASVYLVFVLSYLNSRTEDVHTDIRTISAISTTICYFASLGPEVLEGRISIMNYTNMANVFSALLLAVIMNKLFFALYKVMARNRGDAYTTTFTRGVRCIPVICVCALVAALSAVIFGLQDGIYNFNDFIIEFLSRPFESLGATYAGGLFIMFIESVLWMFGVHGGNVFDTLLTAEDSVFLFSNGTIMSKPFIDTFVLMGGCGTTMCLFGAILLFSRNKRTRKLTRLASIPILFNINELLVFGVPIVFNPVYLIPFVITPMVSYSIAYFAVYMGIVPHIINSSVQWTTPVIISGYQATGSLAGSLLQVALLLIGVLIYMPFVRMADKLEIENERNYMNCLVDICKASEAANQPYHLSNVNATLYSFEDNLFNKLYSDIQNKALPINYQPQVKDGRIVSAEALLRFRYSGDRAVFPPLIVGIARNRGVFEEMTRVICLRALSDMRAVQKYKPDFKMAVNIGLELVMNDDFREWLIKVVEASGITRDTFGIEITEDAKISDADVYQAVFDQLKRSGIEVSMDDFSMGNTSITILQKNYFDYVKIDGSLTRALDNERIRSIVSSIISLGRQLNFNIVAEYVETGKQRDQLLELGCDVFQGYLYYKDMPIDELVRLVEQESQ